MDVTRFGVEENLKGAKMVDRIERDRKKREREEERRFLQMELQSDDDDTPVGLPSLALMREAFELTDSNARVA